MKNKNKILLSLIAILPIALMAQFCGGPDFGGGGDGGGDKINLVIWKLYTEEQTMRPLFEAYQEKYPNVNFSFVEKDIATYEQELLEALASGAGPDIFSIHNDWVPRYKNKLVPAPDGYFPLRTFQEDFVDVVLEDLLDQDDNLYALPLSTDVLALYYNKDLLGSAGIASPPRTWDELISAAKKLTQQDRFGNFVVNGVAMGTAENINRSTDILSLLFLQNGSQIYNNANNSAILDRDISTPDGERYSPGAQALEFYTQFANPSKETYTWNSGNSYSIDAFVSGQVAMMLSYSYMIPTIRNKAPFLNFGIAPVPQIDLSKPRVNYANYFADAVSKASPNHKWAWDFLRFISEEKNLKIYHIGNNVPSSRKDIIATQISDPEIGVFAEGALTAKTFYKPDSNKIEAIFSSMIEDVVLRGKTSDQAISTANRLLNDLLN